MIENCIFCKIANNQSLAAKVYEDDVVLAFLDAFPVSRYHTLVIPKQHYTNLFEIPSQELEKVVTATQKIARVYRDALNIDNIQLLNNCGSFAQQDVFHFHMHIIPRFPLDGNNISWQKHPEFQMDFPEILKQLPSIE
jgi:histidine triad (HIT) family protein